MLGYKIFNRYFFITVFTLIALTTFQNCGQPGQVVQNPAYALLAEPQPIPDPVTLIGKTSLSINDDAPFTQNKDVMLRLEAVGAEEMIVSNNKSVCEAEQLWEAYTQNRPWILENENKEAIVYAKFRKKGAPTTDCISAQIVHDNILPVVSVSQKLPEVTKLNSVSLNFSAADSGSGIKDIKCKDKNDVEVVCADSFVFSSIAAEGNYNVSIVARDLAGNLSVPVVESFIVDRTAPVITINGPTGVIANQNVMFSLSVVESHGLASLSCRLTPQNANFSDCASLKANYDNLVSGMYKFEVKALDKAGNEATAAQSFEVDLTVPTVTITSMPLALSNIKKADFAFSGISGTKAISKFKCSFDNSASANCNSPISYDNLADGAHTFSVIGINEVGTSSSPQTYKFTVDTLAPVLRIVSGPNGTTRQTIAQIILDAQDVNGIKSVMCSLNSGAFADCSNLNVSYTNLADGSYTFVARATDQAGNMTTSNELKWIIDTTPESEIKAQMAQNPVKENATGTLNIELIQVTAARYSCMTNVSKKEVASGNLTSNTAAVPFVVSEDTTCTVSGTNKNNAPIQKVVEAQVSCGNRLKEGGKCSEFVCKRVIALAYSETLQVPARTTEGICYSVKLFDRIANSSSSLTKVKDAEVISRNHDSSNPFTSTPYVLGKAAVNFYLEGPRVAKLSGGLDATSAIRVDNFVLVGLTPQAIAATPASYQAHGTQDATVENNSSSYVLLKNARISLKPFGPAGTATVAPLEIVQEADSQLNYSLDIRALDCGGSRELSEVYLLFQ